MRLLRIALILVVIGSGCAIRHVETSKSLYDRALQAQQAGKDLEAIVHWKAVVAQTSRELQSGNYVTTNLFLRAAARVELGLWDEAVADLKQIDAASLSKEEYWIFPLYLIQIGDYYAQNEMHSVAANFYNSILKKSSYKSSSVYLLALERSMNNEIQVIQIRAAKESDPGKYRTKAYEALLKDVEKYVEEFPQQSVPHYLLADLHAKLDATDEALEHLVAALELGLPSQDLVRSAEFQMATLLSEKEIAAPMKKVILSKAQTWWSDPQQDSVFRAGENQVEWIRQQDPAFTATDVAAGENLRYLAVSRPPGLKVVLWERRK